MSSRKIVNKQKQEGPNSLSEFLDIAPSPWSVCTSSLPAAGRISKNDVNTHRKTARSSTRLHYDVVESGKGKGTSKSRDKPLKRPHNNSS